MPSSTSASNRPTYPIGSVDSALRLLEMLGENEWIRITEAAEELGVARSTAHRLIQMLQYRGFARQDPESKAYTAGPALMGIGLRRVRNLDVSAIARPHLEALARQVGETVHLAALQQGGELLVLESVESPQTLRVGDRTGMVLLAYASAAGRALLAARDDDYVRELYPGPKLPKLHPATIATRTALMKELEVTRQRGFAVQRGETEPDVSGIAASIPDRVGEPTLALTIAVPSSRLSDKAVPRLGRAVVKCAQEIVSALPS